MKEFLEVLKLLIGFFIIMPLSIFLLSRIKNIKSGGQKPQKSNGGWISVEDRLPETSCDVLAVKRNGLIVQMSYHAPFDHGKRIFQWWGFGEWIDQHSQVTHWMPIPDLPDA